MNRNEAQREIDEMNAVRPPERISLVRRIVMLLKQWYWKRKTEKG